MSENLKSCFSKLTVLSKIKNKRLRAKVIADIGDDCLYHALKEIIFNLMQKNIKLSAKERRGLNRCKKIIIRIANHKSKRNRKKLLVQSGGFLHILVPAVAALLGSLIK